MQTTSREWTNPLPGVPLIESPFFDRFFNEAQTEPQTLKTARQLNQMGYAVIDFPDPQFDQLASEIISELTPRLPELKLTSSDGNVRVQDAWEFLTPAKRLATNPQILQLLQTLYGRPAWPFQTLNFRYGTQQVPHTDAVHFSSIPERFMCGVWVALEDVSLESGPLLYYPGSHRWPIFGNEHIDHREPAGTVATQEIYHPLWDALVKQHQLAPERFLAKKGQALIWAANLLHGGDRRINPALTRWSQVTHYYFENCAYLTPMHSNRASARYLYREPTNVITGLKVRGLPRFYDGLVAPIDRDHFDAETYLRENPDVALAGGDPYTHYIDHGFAEGRWHK